MNKVVSFGTITVTYGDQAENHVGMQKLGKGLAPAGFSVNELKDAQKKFEKAGCTCEFIELNSLLPPGITKDHLPDEAGILIIKNAVNMLLQPLACTTKEMASVLTSLEWDKQAKMYGRVVNKKARYNLCFGDNEQKPDIAAGKGTVIDFEDIPCTKMIRLSLEQYLGKKAQDLVAEANWYYDTSKCSISLHGDVERMIVVAVRLGETIPLHYQWYQDSKKVGPVKSIDIEGGDMYIMSEKATGHDWKKRKIYTLRHAAGRPELVL